MFVERQTVVTAYWHLYNLRPQRSRGSHLRVLFVITMCHACVRENYLKTFDIM